MVFSRTLRKGIVSGGACGLQIRVRRLDRLGWVRLPLPSAKVLGALLVLALIAWQPPAAAEPVTILKDSSFDFYDYEGLFDLLVANGAPLVLDTVPSGRITHDLAGSRPLCAFITSRKVPGREKFHWIAETLRYDVVAASPDPAAPPPKPGDLVAVYNLRSLLDQTGNFGFQALVINSYSQFSSVMASRRSNYVLDSEIMLNSLRFKYGLRLTTKAVLARQSSWLSCNEAVSDADAEQISRAWKRGLESGGIRAIYQSRALGGFFPPDSVK